MGCLASRCLDDIDGPPGNEGGEEPKSGQGCSDLKRSRLWQDAIDEFAKGAHDIPIVGENLDDGRLHGAAQAESFSDEAAGENQTFG